MNKYTENRIKAMKWWNSLDDQSQKFAVRFSPRFFYRDHKTMTGREIQELYTETIRDEDE